jgi:hypothetical protein
MTYAIVLLLLVGAALVVWTRRERVPRPEEPADRRIEGIPSMGKVAAPDGWVGIGEPLASEEGLIARGLLDASGIACHLQSTDPLVLGVYPVPAWQVRLFVAPEDAETAAALLAELPAG